MSGPKISFILVNYRTPDLTVACIRSIQKNTLTSPHEIVLADNASGDGSTERIRAECPEVVMIEAPGNYGFGAGCNAAAAGASGEYFYLLNTDTLLHEDSAAALARFLDGKPEAVAVGSALHYPDGSHQASASYFPTLFSIVAGREVISGMLHRLWPAAARLIMASPPEESLTAPVRVGWCVAASLMVRAEAYRAVGGFDEDFFMYAEEMDLCLRLSRLGEVWFTPETSVLHLEGASGGTELNAMRLARIAAGHRLYFGKHYSRSKAWAFLFAWRLSSCIKYLVWRTVALVTRSPRHCNKAEWHRLFLQNFSRLTYPLPR